MKVFVSYSFIDSELHLLTLLFEKLRQGGHYVESSNSYYHFDEDSPIFDDYKITSSDLFIGIITNNSTSIDEVFAEYEFAHEKNVRSILLIEKGVKVNDERIKFIPFDRQNPQTAIKQLFNQGKKNRQVSSKKKSDDLTDVLVGAGIIVGVAALIALLAGGGKK